MRTRKYIIISVILAVIVLALSIVAFMKSKRSEAFSETKTEESPSYPEIISFSETMNMESLANESDPEELETHAANGETEEIIWSKDKIHFVKMDSFYSPESSLPLDAWSRIVDETDTFLKNCDIAAWELTGIPNSLKLIGETYQLQVSISEIPDSILTIFYHVNSQDFDFKYEDATHVYRTENAP